MWKAAAYGEEVYVGRYRAGHMHGRGAYRWANGGRYEGEFRDGKQHGRGLETWASGNRYKGEYRDGKRHGRGIFTFSNGNRYVAIRRRPPVLLARSLAGCDTAHPVYLGHGEDARQLPRWQSGHGADVSQNGERQCPLQATRRGSPSRLHCCRMPHKVRTSCAVVRDTNCANLAGGERAGPKDRLRVGNGRNDE